VCVCVSRISCILTYAYFDIECWFVNRQGSIRGDFFLTLRKVMNIHGKRYLQTLRRQVHICKLCLTLCTSVESLLSRMTGLDSGKHGAVLLKRILHDETLKVFLSGGMIQFLHFVFLYIATIKTF